MLFTFFFTRREHQRQQLFNNEERPSRQTAGKGRGQVRRKESPDNGVTYSCCQETEQERSQASDGVMGQGSKGGYDNNFRKNHP